MNRAIELAKFAALIGEVPVGAVIVHRATKQIVAEAYNSMQKKKNQLFHAEIIAINAAGEKLNDRDLRECDIYVSLEPCHMCAAAISFAHLGKLFYGAKDLKQGAVEHGYRYYTSNSCFHRPEIYGGMGEEISSSLIKNFFSNVRKNSL